MTQVASSDVRVVLHPAEIERLKQLPELGRYLVEAAGPGVRRAQAAAPRLTGAGAASIHAEAVLDGPEWTARASWDREHWYMRLHEQGSRYMSARPFLVPAWT